MFASQTEKDMLADRYYRLCDKQRLITMPYHKRCMGKREERYKKMQRGTSGQAGTTEKSFFTRLWMYECAHRIKLTFHFLLREIGET